MSEAKNIFELYLENTLQKEPTMSVDAHGNKRWKLHNRLHRIGAPAIEGANGGKSWWVNGALHREDGPALEAANGDREWYQWGKLHREDGAAIEYADGDKAWYINNKNYNDVAAWAKAALEHQGIEPTPDAIDAKVAQVMQHDLFD